MRTVFIDSGSIGVNTASVRAGATSSARSVECLEGAAGWVTRASGAAMLAPMPSLLDGAALGDWGLAAVASQLANISSELGAAASKMRGISSSLGFAADRYEQAELRATGVAGFETDFVTKRFGYFKADRVQTLMKWLGERLEPKLSEWDWNARTFLASAFALRSGGDFKAQRNYFLLALGADRTMRTRFADTPLERSAAFLTSLYPVSERISGSYKSTLKMQRSEGASPALFWRRSEYRYGLDGFDVRTDATYSAQVEQEMLSVPRMTAIWSSLGAVSYPRLARQSVRIPQAADLPGPAGQKAVETPMEASDLVTRVKTLRNYPQGAGVEGPHSTHGEFEILRHDNGGRRPSWSVIVRGTQEWTPGTANPKDMHSNLELIAGVPADEQSAIMAALELEGAKPGDVVELAGHSQGGMLAGAMAANRTFTDRYSVAAVVAAGSPIAGMNIPSSTPVLSFENADDMVPALDGEPARASQTHISVYSPGRGEGAHSLTGYETDALAAEQLGNADLQRWNEQRLQAMGITEDSKTTRQRYTITRVKG